MKANDVFEMSYLELIKVIFFGKKIPAVPVAPDVRVYGGNACSAETEAHPIDPNEIHGDTSWTFGLPGHHPYPTVDFFQSHRD